MLLMSPVPSFVWELSRRSVVRANFRMLSGSSDTGWQFVGRPSLEFYSKVVYDGWPDDCFPAGGDEDVWLVGNSDVVLRDVACQPRKMIRVLQVRLKLLDWATTFLLSGGETRHCGADEAPFSRWR